MRTRRNRNGSGKSELLKQYLKIIFIKSQKNRKNVEKNDYSSGTIYDTAVSNF